MTIYPRANRAETHGQSRATLRHPRRQIVPHILVNQKRHPRSRHHPHHAGHQPPVKPNHALFHPDPPHDASDSPPKPLVGAVILHPAPKNLIRVRHRAGHQLGHAGYHNGSLVGQPRVHVPLGDAVVKVHPLGGLVHGELDGAVGDAQQRDGKASVEAAHALGAQDRPRAGQHGGVGARGALVRREHARLEHPDGVGEHRGRGAGEGRGQEVVRRRGADAAVGVGDGALEAGLEEEEGRPGRGVSDEVGREAAVEGEDGPAVGREGAQDGDCCRGRGRLPGAAVDWAASTC